MELDKNFTKYDFLKKRKILNAKKNCLAVSTLSGKISSERETVVTL